MRALVVGVDAACAGVLDPLFAADDLPTLQRLFADGASGPLESHAPPWTPSMWPSIYTGVNPGKHGVFSFLTYEGYDWDLVNATRVREHALWELLDHLGRTSVVVKVPVTHPPRAFDGALVPGYTATESPTCHPEGVLEEVEAELGAYRVYAEDCDDRDEALTEYRRLTRMRGEAFRHLCAEYDPDFGFLQFQATDTVFHEYPGETALVRGIYRAVDAEVEATLDACDPDTVFVVSDHGIGEYDGYGFAVNEFLARHGYVETAEHGAGMPSWVPIRENRLRDGADADGGDGSADGGLSRRALSAAARLGITPRRAVAALERVGLRDAVVERLPSGLRRAGGRQVDFAASTAYMRARIDLGVRINLAGREPEGVVPPEEYDAVRADLVELLSGVETPDGDPVFEEVVPREAYFEGPYVDDAVDVVTVPADFDRFLTADLLDDPFGDPGQPWNHKRTGVFAAAGEGVEGDAVSDAHVFDVAPTVLAAMGHPVSDRMDGRVLSAVDRTAERSYPAYDGAGEGAASGDVAERLEDLGYLER